MRVTYDREGFIKFSPVSKKTAEKYCNEHPKERYDDADFNAVYYLEESAGWGRNRVVGSGRWSETDTDRDRLIDDFNGSIYGYDD